MSICKVDGCESKHKAKGYCLKHYKHFLRYGFAKRSRKEPNEIILHEDCAEILLYNMMGEEVARALIDIEDVEKVIGIKWGYEKGGRVRGFCIIDGKRKLVKLHRHLLQVDSEIDHINRNQLDNRKRNLRKATSSQNKMNKGSQKGSRVKYKGVAECRTKYKMKYTARIAAHGKRKYLGIYDTAIEAAKAYNNAAIKLHKDFACLNAFE